MTLADELIFAGKLVLANAGKKLERRVNQSNEKLNPTFLKKLKKETKRTDDSILLEKYEREAEEYRQKYREREKAGNYSYKTL